MLNFDFFVFMKYRNDYFVGVFYLVNFNLFRSIWFKWENIIVVSIILGLEKELILFNEFLVLLEEMKVLWNGLYLKLNLCCLLLCFRVVIVCIFCDVLVVRKICGFKNYNFYGCLKCFKLFFGNVKDLFDFLGFKREEWLSRDIRLYRWYVRELLRVKIKVEYDRLVKKYGLYNSVLLELSYFDCIRFIVIDLMYNLFLGIVKLMFKLWME